MLYHMPKYKGIESLYNLTKLKNGANLYQKLIANLQASIPLKELTLNLAACVSFQYISSIVEPNNPYSVQ